MAEYTTWASAQFTDGSTTIDLADNLSYSVVSYQPAVSKRVESNLTGRGDYPPVMERIDVEILGDSSAKVWTNLNALIDMLAAANAYWRGEGDHLVTFRALSERGVTVHPFEAVLVPQPDGRPVRDAVKLPPDFHQQIVAGRDVGPVTVHFWRQGAFLGAKETATSGAEQGIDRMSVTMPSTLDIPGPTRVRLQFDDFSGFDTLADSYLILSETATTDWTFSDRSGHADTDAAKGGAVEQSWGLNDIALDAATEAYNRIAVFAAVRAVTHTTPIALRAEATVGHVDEDYSNTILIKEQTDPQVVFLGIVETQFVALQSVTTTGQANHEPASNLEWDWVYFVPYTDTTRIIKMPGLADLVASTTVDSEVWFDHHSLISGTPEIVNITDVSATTAAGNETPVFYGNAYIPTTGTNVTAVFLGTHDPASATGNKWQLWSGTTSTIGSFKVTLERYKSYLTPI